MRIRAASLALSVGVLAFAGCGETSNTPTATARRLPKGVSLVPPPQVKSVIYNLHLVPTAGIKPNEPAGEPNGSGQAVISINAESDQLCGSFSRVTNVTTPWVARFYRWQFGNTYRRGETIGTDANPSGCLHLTPVVLKLIERRPDLYIAQIDNARFPRGAVRAPLSGS